MYLKKNLIIYGSSHKKEKKMKENTFKFENIIVQQLSLDRVYFSPDDDPKEPFDVMYPSTYLIPIQWVFWGVPEDDEELFFEAFEEADFSKCTKIGELSGYLILCKLMISDGYDPWQVCDDEQADLGYVISALVDNGGPLNKRKGSSNADIFYIHELNIEEQAQKQGLDGRVLQQIPALCKELLHIKPDILTYIVSSTSDEGASESEKISDFYQKIGFQKAGTQLLYVHSDEMK